MRSTINTVLKNLTGSLVVLNRRGLQQAKSPAKYHSVVSDNSKGISKHHYYQGVNRISNTNH